MLEHPNWDAVAFAIGPLKVHWYGLMYLAAFAQALLLGWYRAAQPWSPLKRNQVEDLIVWAAFGVVIGGRLGYVFFYGFEQFTQDPIWLFKIWTGGMSFHGGLIGVIVAMALYARKLGTTFTALMDFVAPLVPLGYAFGRFGNFIGQELWGRATTAAIGMRFPADPSGEFRHPSQLYQAGLEGILLFGILFVYSIKPRARGTVAALYLTLYGCFRFFIEFYREPDGHIGFDLFGWMTRGQLLCLPMIVVGSILLAYFWWRHQKAQPKVESTASDDLKTEQSSNA